MAEESKIAYVGLIEVVPMGVEVISSKRQRNETNEVERTSRTIYKDKEGGCSTQFTKQHKAGEFVDKKTGGLGFKEEVKYKSTLKFDDKVQGCTNEYQTQIKFKQVDYGKNKTTPKTYSYKRLKHY